MKIPRIVILSLGVMFSLGCTTTEVVLNPRWNSYAKPVYTDYFDYYWLGFVGTNSVDLQRVCMDEKPYAIQKVRTFEDIFLASITLGIYTPLTVKVWCGSGT